MGDLDIEIRKLSPAHVYKLSTILECGEGWKQLMAIIPNEDTQALKYTAEHMKMVECAGEKQRRTAAEVLFEEWGTSGRKRPTLSLLRALLVKAELFRAADYVSEVLLKEEAPERPREGPAAAVEVPNTETLQALLKPSAPPFQPSLASEYTAFSAHFKETRPITSQSELDVSGLSEWTYDELRGVTGEWGSRLGGGASGEVFLWASAHLAVKRLLPSSPLSTSGVSDAFRRELRLLSDVQHPNLLRLVGFSADGPSPCLVYPFMERGSLLNALQAGDPNLDWFRRLRVAQETAQGVLHLHTLGERPLVHRDIKTANILLDSDYTAKVGDFGLVRGGPGADQTSAQTTTVVGTSAYMAPEAFRGDISPKMDVYSFGVVLLELITGLPPYDENREGCDLVSHIEEVDDIQLLIDQRPTWDGKAEKLTGDLYKLSELCLLEKKHRPTMAKILQSLLELSLGPDDAG